ncbi:hypothetical protein PGTUg99_005603 [Puccinia graminis f. sp. tritici]|uniref:DUF6589 domain-containing protein n=1 Tax=Puccinia graminis f. sp. tritici TaxID=56615 RepID=A0A5B0Q0S8_PUCGR|nr:hypothetical protein PGTUg99_000334 [Puccinia graminis f. sp. tritici]KAA1118331.1 hypothetical protein PGTUg99_005603 [Puccinia graminis f. sp. tritici]
MNGFQHDGLRQQTKRLTLKDNDSIQFAIHRRYWGTRTGWETTIEVIHSIRDTVCKHNIGKKYWEDLILSEASTIVNRQKPAIRSRSFYSAVNVDPNLFGNEMAREQREKKLVEEDMPFMFQLIKHKLSNTLAHPDPSKKSKDDEPECDSDSEPEGENSNDDLFDGEIGKPDRSSGIIARKNRIQTTSRVICSMIGFVLNRRNNTTQLENSVTFLACGISDRVNRYLHHIGLTSSRKTGNKSLEDLGKQAQEKILTKLSTRNVKSIAPFLCIDNSDFEQHIHTKSQGKNSEMFHGTWGYIHDIDPKLQATVSPADLTLESCLSALEKIPSIRVSPRMLIATPEEEKHWVLVLKSQIGKVLLEHIAKPSDKEAAIRVTPPPIDQISHEKPDITMLKLMIASDNSAQGIGEVCTGIIQQSDLEPADFFSRLQVLDGDLCTCANIQSLRGQRIPSPHKVDTLNNLLTSLGGSHTLWNIGLAIFELHYGNSSDSRDCGAWRWLESLGIPTSKSSDKKDFTKMIQNIEKVHEATIVYCIM